MIDRLKIESECPYCKSMISYTVTQLQKGRTITCSKCGNKIVLKEPESGFVEKINQDIKDSISRIPGNATVRK